MEDLLIHIVIFVKKISKLLNIWVGFVEVNPPNYSY